MREMKDSGIEWVGYIPQYWDVIRGKYVFSYVQKPVRDDDGVVTCFRDGEVTLRSNRREDGFTMSDKEVGYQGIDIGDLIVHGMDGFSGAIGISDSRGKASPVLNVLETDNNKRYCMYLLRAMAWSGLFMSLATGIRVRTCDTNWGKLRDVLYLIPPKKEQDAIASFLDSKCAEIDTLSADIQSEIDTLDAYKRSVITEAVTKGLDKNAPMKDSGTSWLGSIPSHWDIGRIDSFYTLRNTKVSDKDYPPLSVTINGIVPQLDTAAKTNAHDDRKLVRKGDFAINSRSDRRGSCGISAYDGSVSLINTVLKPKGKMNPEYYGWLFHTIQFADEFYKCGHGIVDDLWTTNYQDMKKIKIPVPPLAEQSDIADHLNSKCAEIDAIIADKQEQLAVLADYKKSLIYEYVTGKKEVAI